MTAVEWASDGGHRSCDTSIRRENRLSAQFRWNKRLNIWYLTAIVFKRRNLLKVPDSISHKIARLKPRPIVVGCLLKINAGEIRKGQFMHIGISWSGGKPEFSSSIVPSPKNGRYSYRNANGYEVVRRDLPMVTKTYSIETPNYGDWSLGSHDVSFDREVYQRDVIPPRDNELSIDLVGQEAGIDEIFVFKFAISEVMDTTRRNLTDDLLFNLNLLHENVGASDVFASDAGVDQYLRTVYVNWEILPPGERDRNIAKIVKALGDTPEIREKVKDRYEFFEKLNPEAFIQGHGGFKRYFGAKFSDNLVVFENMEYGNAIYAMFKNWAEQSKKTKLELLASGRAGKDFVRIPHLTAWKNAVKNLIKERL